MTAFLLMVLFGMGIEFSVHLVKRFQAEARRLSLAAALDETFLSTGRSILTSGFATTLGMAVLIFSRLRGFSEFGVISAVSIFAIFLAMFVVLPPLFVVSTRLGLLGEPSRSPQSGLRWLPGRLVTAAALAASRRSGGARPPVAPIRLRLPEPPGRRAGRRPRQGKTSRGVLRLLRSRRDLRGGRPRDTRPRTRADRGREAQQVRSDRRGRQRARLRAGPRRVGEARRAARGAAGPPERVVDEAGHRSQEAGLDPGHPQLPDAGSAAAARGASGRGAPARDRGGRFRGVHAVDRHGGLASRGARGDGVHGVPLRADPARGRARPDRGQARVRGDPVAGHARGAVADRRHAARRVRPRCSPTGGGSASRSG